MVMMRSEAHTPLPGYYEIESSTLAFSPIELISVDMNDGEWVNGSLGGLIVDYREKKKPDCWNDSLRIAKTLWVSELNMLWQLEN